MSAKITPCSRLESPHLSAIIELRRQISRVNSQISRAENALGEFEKYDRLNNGKAQSSQIKYELVQERIELLGEDVKRMQAQIDLHTEILERREAYDSRFEG